MKYRNMFIQLTQEFTPRKRYRLEKEFQEKFLQYLRAKQSWCYKLTDASMGFKPYDLIAVLTNGDSCHIELKIADDYLAWDDLRPNQHAAL